MSIQFSIYWVGDTMFDCLQPSLLVCLLIPDGSFHLCLHINCGISFIVSPLCDTFDVVCLNKLINWGLRRVVEKLWGKDLLLKITFKDGCQVVLENDLWKAVPEEQGWEPPKKRRQDGSRVSKSSCVWSSLTYWPTISYL